MNEKVEVLSNCSNIEQHALEELVNSLSPNNSLDDISNNIQNYKGSERMNKKHSQFFSESSSDHDEEFQNLDTIGNVGNKLDINGEHNAAFKTDKPMRHKSRIRALSSSESDEDSKNNSIENFSNKYDLSRVKNRKKKLSAKFNKLILKENKMSSNKVTSNDESSGEQNTSQVSENSDEELTSCDKIKKVIIPVLSKIFDLFLNCHFIKIETKKKRTKQSLYFNHAALYANMLQ